MYTIKDCTDEDLNTVNIQGRYVILKEDFFKAEFRDEKYQLVICTGGFGCDPSNSGNTIMVKELNENPESYCVKRYNHDILGIAKDAVVAAHKEKYL